VIEQSDSFAARGSVIRVVHVDDDQLLIALHGRGDGRVRAIGHLNGISGALQEQTQRFANVGLVIDH